MNVRKPLKPGSFLRNGREYLALSEVSRTLNVPAHEVTDAVSLGDLHVERVSGCKVVELAEVMRYISLREARK
ncbi:hypothetical protein [Marinobacter salsuginis]|uniref:hypothetical protein n=1 Tax=Marinobacter salsuginis TaxID=418719 RepID=UPI00273F96E3|nr:hypothetical protein [Marinobacter salsuginis]